MKHGEMRRRILGTDNRRWLEHVLTMPLWFTLFHVLNRAETERPPSPELAYRYETVSSIFGFGMCCPTGIHQVKFVFGQTRRENQIQWYECLLITRSSQPNEKRKRASNVPSEKDKHTCS